MFRFLQSIATYLPYAGKELKKKTRFVKVKKRDFISHLSIEIY